ncbi:hypothetical protein CP880_07280 [Cutibacterium namnetense]|uniref:Uncharacterized protein n=1 Tax=Cutibacterium namnetense TaxID=1574624 RepID=A0ABX9ICF3_9ACTN|nr:hypothetical protein CP880_07280 [Cutibacterium namnetense]
MVQGLGLILGQDDDPAGPIGEPFEHELSLYVEQTNHRNTGRPIHPRLRETFMQPTDGTGPPACVLSLITAADRSAIPVYAAGTTQVEQRDAGALLLRRRH